MSDANLPLILHPGTDLILGKTQSGRIVTEMVGGVLALSRAVVNASEALVPRFKIGEHTFCEPDYRQILIWSKALALEPVIMADQLLRQSMLAPEERLLRSIFGDLRAAHLVNGRLEYLDWDLDLWPLSKFEWVPDLSISHLNISGRSQKMRSLEVPLEDLTILNCDEIGLREVDLSGARKLQYLSCPANELTRLDLSVVPQLTSLSCGGNQLRSLDLSDVPQLKSLRCGGNQLRSLDLSNVPQLNSLGFGDLYERWSCENETLPVLDIRPLEKLEELDCFKNKPRLIQRPDQNF